MSFVATAIGVAGAVGGAAISANAASKQQKKGFNRQDQGIQELINLRDQQNGSPLVQRWDSLLNDRFNDPWTYSPELIASLKANSADDIARGVNGQLESLRARQGAAGLGRSGTSIAAQNRVAAAYGPALAGANRQIDQQAAMQRQQDLAFIDQLMRGYLGITQQPTRDIANAYINQGAQIAQTPNPWAGFWNQAGQGVAGGATSYLAAQNQAGQQAENARRWDQYMAYLNGNRGGGAGINIGGTVVDPLTGFAS